MSGKNSRIVTGKGICLLLFTVWTVLYVSCIYMKMDPPPDVNKADHGHNDMPTCWLANAANMLAGAGYGNGNTVQKRATEIYQQMTLEFTDEEGNIPLGWTDTAIDWWIHSDYNSWPNNPYKEFKILGYKEPIPWEDRNGPKIIGNFLRECNFVGLSINMVSGIIEGGWSHAFTAWGDNVGNVNSPSLADNPRTIRATDSEPYKEGLVQFYLYDGYENPNPEGNNEGPGWYINYFLSTHPYIKHIVVLYPVDKPTEEHPLTTVVGSYSIHQSNPNNATGLDYKIHSNAEILSYKTGIDWETPKDPTIVESQPERKELDVIWDLSDRPVPACNLIDITTELVLPEGEAMEYSDVHFTYQPLVIKVTFPWLRWKIQAQPLENAEAIPNVSGGYVIGSFDIFEGFKPDSNQKPTAVYRFIRRYAYDRSPEKLHFVLSGKEGFHIKNVRFGHSYGFLKTKNLWEFNDWNTPKSPDIYSLSDDPIQIPISWEKKLTYPKGENSTGKFPPIK